ncbi:MAG: PHP domain-containing protein [Candidatus Stahlbacteria bacterium]|nr:PHP domain-containing protein [Candidatus Stahlbacteria bacterium]
MSGIDLHIHTIFSDGTLTPAEVVRVASDVGLTAIAIADHDEIGGINPAIEEVRSQKSEIRSQKSEIRSQKSEVRSQNPKSQTTENPITDNLITVNRIPIEVVPAVEISSQLDDRSVHILGYFIDLLNPELNDLLSFICKARIERSEQIVLSLQELGIFVDIKEIEKIAGPGVICRPHIAAEMINRGIVANKEEAFGKYLSYHSPCYVPKINKPTPEVIKIINNAGGIPVIAHPSYLSEEGIKKIIDDEVLQKLRNSA